MKDFNRHFAAASLAIAGLQPPAQNHQPARSQNWNHGNFSVHSNRGKRERAGWLQYHHRRRACSTDRIECDTEDNCASGWESPGSSQRANIRLFIERI